MMTPGYIPPHPSPRKPQLSLPKGACDSHCHVFGPADRFPYAPTSSYIPCDAPKEGLFALHRHLGFERAVIVQASCHGKDNRAMQDALRASAGSCKGIAIVDASVSDAELEALHEDGVLGVRFNFVPRLKAAQSLDERRSILRRIAKLGWHLVVYFEPGDLAGITPFLEEVEIPVVIDHMGRCPPEEGVTGPAFERLARLMQSDSKYWIKISGAERLTRQGPPYADVDPIARELLRIAPDRTLFGTDWPHPNMEDHAPDDGLLVDRLAGVCSPDDLKRVLVDNPTRLYWPEQAAG